MESFYGLTVYTCTQTICVAACVPKTLGISRLDPGAGRGGTGLTHCFINKYYSYAGENQQENTKKMTWCGTVLDMTHMPRFHGTDKQKVKNVFNAKR